MKLTLNSKRWDGEKIARNHKFSKTWIVESGCGFNKVMVVKYNKGIKGPMKTGKIKLILLNQIILENYYIKICFFLFYFES